MSSPRFEGFLARLYSDQEFAARFLARPAAVVEESGLDDRERRAALAIDPLELQLACRSFAVKRAAHRRPLARSLAQSLRRLFRLR